MPFDLFIVNYFHLLYDNARSYIARRVAGYLRLINVRLLERPRDTLTLTRSITYGDRLGRAVRWPDLHLLQPKSLEPAMIVVCDNLWYVQNFRRCISRRIQAAVIKASVMQY